LKTESWLAAISKLEYRRSQGKLLVNFSLTEHQTGMLSSEAIFWTYIYIWKLAYCYPAESSWIIDNSAQLRLNI
jgi:hypothetical protein